jgi:phosphoglycolate phosphatase
MEMGRNAGIHAIGVSWGYHPAEALSQAGARRVLTGFGQLAESPDDIWGET